MVVVLNKTVMKIKFIGNISNNKAFVTYRLKLADLSQDIF